jgi:hypothetical protein
MSKITAMHTLADLAELAEGHLAPDEAASLLRSVKKGLTPVQLACLRTALQTDRLMDLLEGEANTEAPTQADRIEALLGTIVGALEQQSVRLSAIEHALARRSA